MGIYSFNRVEKFHFISNTFTSNDEESNFSKILLSFRKKKSFQNADLS